VVKSVETSDGDAFLSDLAELGEGASGLEGVAQSLPDLPAGADARARILGQLDPYARFARFEAAVADLLHVSRDEAAAALKRIDDASAWQEQAPGLAYMSVPSGPDADYFLSGFLRVDAGLEFPPHEHLGEEITFVLQGAFVETNSGQLFRPGQPSIMPGGSQHTFRVLAGGPNLIGLITVKVGVRLVGDGNP
jgi:hypothetical protein